MRVTIKQKDNNNYIYIHGAGADFVIENLIDIMYRVKIKFHLYNTKEIRTSVETLHLMIALYCLYIIHRKEIEIFLNGRKINAIFEQLYKAHGIEILPLKLQNKIVFYLYPSRKNKVKQNLRRMKNE